MHLASNRLYVEPTDPHAVLEALAIASHALAVPEAVRGRVRPPHLTVTEARKFITRNTVGLRLDMPDLGDLRCRLLVTPSIGGKVWVIDCDLYRGDVPMLVTKAVQTLPEVLRKRTPVIY